jgi:hypothetical protein
MIPIRRLMSAECSAAATPPDELRLESALAGGYATANVGRDDR